MSSFTDLVSVANAFTDINKGMLAVWCATNLWCDRSFWCGYQLQSFTDSTGTTNTFTDLTGS